MVWSGGRELAMFFCQARLCCVWVPASARETVGLRGILARARARGKASLLLPIALCESVIQACQHWFLH